MWIRMKNEKDIINTDLLTHISRGDWEFNPTIKFSTVDATTEIFFETIEERDTTYNEIIRLLSPKDV